MADLQHEMNETHQFHEEKMKTRYCMETSMSGAEGHRSCLLCSQKWEDHICSLCSISKRQKTTSYCKECSEEVGAKLLGVKI